jgi:RecA/RadA recombinase
MAKRLNKSLMETVSKEIKSSFNLNSFKDKKGLISNVKFKEQKWIPFSSALQKALSLPGIPMGHITMVRGKSNTGKSTLSIEAVIAAQKSGILPVIIITEMKHSWEHWRTMDLKWRMY